ncbi:MAG: YqeG family HAD IIIA-type phosphatase [Clostridia bacterium]|nr:YqeG family HAD IIIA-type phosphatase [Clostridia bacterium]
MSWFVPDYIFAKFCDVTPKFLREIGVEALLIDIDNTLAPYEQAEPDENIKAWFSALDKAGIKATLVSNNDRERVELFNKSLGLPAYYKSGKPFAKNLKKAMAGMGSDKNNTAMLGDQLLTDAMAGKHIGLRAIIVPPIRDKQNAFFRAKRALEVGSIKKYVKKAKKRGDSTQKVCGDAEMICAFWLEKRFSAKYLKNQRKIEEK